MKLSSRKLFLFIFACCAGLLGYAYYAQYVQGLEPCNLCIIQRVFFYALGIVALIAAIHGPGNTGRKVYAVFASLAALGGLLVAWRHVWMQGLPEDQIPDCGPGLNYMLDVMPMSEVWHNLFYGSGSCADINWTFMGLSMPAWVLVWFIFLLLVSLLVLFRKDHNQARYV